MISRKKKIWGIVILIVVVAVGGIAWQSSTKKEPGTEVTVEKAEHRRLVSTVSAEGEVEPVEQVKVSAEIPGKIIKLTVKEGDPVEKGQFLVELNPETYLANLESARSALRSARASKDKAQADLKRITELVAKGMSSQADLDAAKASDELAAGELDRASAGDKSARESLAKTRISAPMSGTVSQLNKEVGELTLGSQFQEDVIMIVADLGRMQVRADVDENEIVGVKVGDSSRVEIDAFPDTTFRGVVREISQSAAISQRLGVDATAKNFAVEVEIVDQIAGIRPGMSATVDIITDVRDNVLSVSLQCVALREKEEGKAVELKTKEKKSSKEIAAEVKSGTADSSIFTQEELEEGVFVFAKDSAAWKPVKTGLSSDRHIEIISGVAEGDSVISGPYRALAKDLSAGDKVKLKSKEEKGKKGEKKS